jgi:hypothetical protein
MAFAPGERGSFQYQMFLWLLGLSRCVGAALGGSCLRVKRSRDMLSVCSQALLRSELV